jgi:hypothetical protein
MNPAELKMQPTIHHKEKPDIYRLHVQPGRSNVLWVAFSIPPGSLSPGNTLYSVQNNDFHAVAFPFSACFLALKCFFNTVRVVLA